MNYKDLPSFINDFEVLKDLGIKKINKKSRRFLQAKCKKCLRIFVTTKDHILRNQLGCSRLCSKNNGGNKKLLRIREGMIARCKNKNHVSFSKYSYLDIDSSWLISTKSFYDWAKKNGYQDGLSLDRIDNSKGYFPENCRWVDKRIQSQNSSNAKLDIDKVINILKLSKTMQQKDIAILFKVSTATINGIIKGIRWTNIPREK